MKKIYYIGLFLISGVISAQEKPKNVSEESTIKTIKTNDGSGVVEKQIKVTTRLEQGIEFNAEHENKTDKDIVDSPVRVNKTIEINNGMANSYNSKTEIGYYEFEGKQYDFKKVDNGFIISSQDNETLDGNIVKINKENHYIYRNGDDTGIGYFNDDGSFTIEIYDKETKTLKRQDFKVKP